MQIEYNDHEMIVTFGKEEFDGKTVHFHGEQLKDGSFLACPLFVNQVGTGTFTFGGKTYKIDEEVVGEELAAMMRAISAYCEGTSQRVMFEEIEFVPYIPSKGKLIATRRDELIILIEEGTFAGQTVRWWGELLYDGFALIPFAAAFVRPPSQEQLSDISLKGIKVIQEVEKSEYPALMQVFRDICETEREKLQFV